MKYIASKIQAQVKFSKIQTTSFIYSFLKMIFLILNLYPQLTVFWIPINQTEFINLKKLI